MSIQFVIVGAPRTGSTLLVKTLNCLEGVVCHGELLGLEQVRGYEDGFDLQGASKSERDDRLRRLFQERDADPTGFIERSLNCGSSATGFKALYSAFLHQKWRDVRTSLLASPHLKFVHLTRNNTLRRFISEQILEAGGPIHSGAGGRSDIPVKVHVDIDTFVQRSSEIDAQAVQLGSVLSNQSVLDITYEELAAETAATVSRVGLFLGLNIAPTDIEPALKKVGAVDLRDSVSNYQDLLDNTATRTLALAD